MWRYSYDLGDLMVFVTVAARQEQRPSFFLETGVGRGGGDGWLLGIWWRQVKLAEHLPPGTVSLPGDSYGTCHRKARVKTSAVSQLAP